MSSSVRNIKLARRSKNKLGKTVHAAAQLIERNFGAAALAGRRIAHPSFGGQNGLSFLVLAAGGAEVAVTGSNPCHSGCRCGSIGRGRA